MRRELAAGQAGHRDRVERGFGNQVGEWGGKGEGTRKAEIPGSKRSMRFSSRLQTKVRPLVKVSRFGLAVSVDVKHHIYLPSGKALGW